jgi:hypothetical protein
LVLVVLVVLVQVQEALQEGERERLQEKHKIYHFAYQTIITGVSSV